MTRKTARSPHWSATAPRRKGPANEAMLPVMLAVGLGIPEMPMETFALLLALTLGIMGILTPYATGPSPVYYGSGYIPSKDYWRLGAIFGVIFFVTLLVIGLPWIAMIR